MSIEDKRSITSRRQNLSRCICKLHLMHQTRWLLMHDTRWSRERYLLKAVGRCHHHRPYVLMRLRQNLQWDVSLWWRSMLLSSILGFTNVQSCSCTVLIMHLFGIILLMHLFLRDSGGGLFFRVSKINDDRLSHVTPLYCPADVWLRGEHRNTLCLLVRIVTSAERDGRGLYFLVLYFRIPLLGCLMR